MEYTFLSEFDLLRSTCREDITLKPWATPSGRMALDQHFKEEQAREEIKRLNIEIRRFITSIRDNNNHLLSVEEALKSVDPILAWHVAEYSSQATRFDALHLRRLSMLHRLRGFTGDLMAGIAVEPYSSVTVSFTPSATDEEEEEESDEETDDEAEAELEAEVVDAMGVAIDPPSNSTGILVQG